jgi:cytoplasmic iron level regulating protein YaaA (DUF328/UPF0246 family)
VLILLPPSEGKTRGGDGPPVDLATLSWPDLDRARRRVATALVSVCRRSPKKAREYLGLSEALDDDRIANAELLESPTMPAGRRYSGILHDALDYPTLPAAARRRADASLVVFSGLWGAVRPTDSLPAYRIGINTKLPRIGPLPSYWRDPLGAALEDAIASMGALDFRSSGYSQMYRPSRDAAAALVPVAITGPDGTKAASSYQSKVAKGRLVRELLRAGAPSPEEVIAAAETIGLTAAADRSGLTVRVPASWGLINPPKK